MGRSKRTSITSSIEDEGSSGKLEYSHSGQLRRGAAGDLLCSELAEFGLELLELLLQVLLALAPQLAGFDLCR